MPSSSLTLSDVRAQLSWITPDSTEFLQNLNQARQAILTSGLWAGCIRPIIFNGSASGFITLPPWLESIVGVSVDKIPQMVFSEFHQYIECGPGTIDNTFPGIGQLMFVGSYFPSVLDMLPGEQLRFRISNATDAAKIIRVFFNQTDDTPYYDAAGVEGKQLALINPIVDTGIAANKFTGLSKPVTLGTLSVYSHNTTTNVDTLLSVYNPSETRPQYSRYQTGTWDDTHPIGCLCQIKYTPLVADTDFCLPDDINALEFAMQAVDASHTRQYDEAKLAWSLCYDQLNSNLKAQRGKAQPVITFLGPGSNRTRVKCN